jgi:transposase
MLSGLFTIAKCTTSVYLKENINADVFHAWTTKQLIPSLPERSVIVMDNAAFHKRTDRSERRDTMFYYNDYPNIFLK